MLCKFLNNNPVEWGEKQPWQHQTLDLFLFRAFKVNIQHCKHAGLQLFTAFAMNDHVLIKKHIHKSALSVLSVLMQVRD